MGLFALLTTASAGVLAAPVWVIAVATLILIIVDVHSQHSSFAAEIRLSELTSIPVLASSIFSSLVAAAVSYALGWTAGLWLLTML